MKSTMFKDLSWMTLQLVLLAALLWMPAFGLLPFLVPIRALGLLVCSAGLVLSAAASWQLQAGRSLTPMPSPRRGAALITRGLYRRVRHPVYSGLLIWAFGIAIATASVLHFVLFGLLGAFFNAKAAHEERLLTQKFSDYPEYVAHTPRFLPSPTQSR
ncbi:MAG: isoprenylcysteine carboxylmethyltransferase family protein [Verrucomicrobia bacterium]|nr:isoprenylcysteine carboxylmethyltransferase family protein [Verrucomicrobiota bacterium]